MHYIYLAGPISGLTYDEASDWRTKVSAQLNSTQDQIRCLSPLRGKEHLKGNGVLHSGTYEGTLTSAKGIMRRDFFDCTRSTIVIANLLGTKKVSIGTVMELAWCYQSKIPVILIDQPFGGLHDHVMLNDAATYTVGTIEEAIEVSRLLLGSSR